MKNTASSEKWLKYSIIFLPDILDEEDELDEQVSISNNTFQRQFFFKKLDRFTSVNMFLYNRNDLAF